jgi:hypothetical protein
MELEVSRSIRERGRLVEPFFRWHWEGPPQRNHCLPHW